VTSQRDCLEEAVTVRQSKTSLRQLETAVTKTSLRPLDMAVGDVSPVTTSLRQSKTSSTPT